MGSIELQIAHGQTPIPFMVPLKKASDPETLRAIIRSRTGCPVDTKITMYNRALKVIHWDDWEDIVEADGYYMADLNDHWVQHLIARGTVGSSSDKVQGFLGTLVTAGRGPAAPASPSLPVSGPVTKQGPVATATTAVAVASKPMQKPLGVAGPVTPKVRFADDSIHQKMEVNESVVKELQKQIAEMNVVYKMAANKGKKVDDGPARDLFALKKENAPIGIEPIKALPVSRPAIATPPADIAFVKGKESYNAIEEKLRYGEYGKSERPTSPYEMQSPRKAAPYTPIKTPATPTRSAKASNSKVEIRPSYFFRVLKPNPRSIEQPGGRVMPYVMAVPKSETPEHFLRLAHCDHFSTRLLRVLPARDFASYQVMDAINPGSRFATASFKKLEWPCGSYVCWETVQYLDGSNHHDSSPPWDGDSEAEAAELGAEEMDD
ncbi:hypothetical protein TWF696_000652 [Orbilia brochopaga]|uniref:Uncharacterized protein n=1 Tax=Orbilia brochopaga TaxID=3140254 RepID=A0AAV9VFH0_9PEZI